MHGTSLFLLISGAAVLVAVFLGLRELVIPLRQERPDRVIGKVLRFSDVEGVQPPTLPLARVASFDGTRYLVQFIATGTPEGQEFETALIAARHKGYPISSVRSRGILAVGGRASSGKDFIACINIA